MFLSALLSYLYKDGITADLILSGFLVSIIGLLMLLLNKNHDKQINKREGYLVVVLGWVAMILSGTIPYILTGTIDGFSNIFFETTSGYTATGATIINDVEVLPEGILFWRSITHWLGGMGMIVFAIAILPLLGQLNSTPLTTGSSDTRILSYLARANYSFMNKYVLTSTLRVDGVSKFSEGNRYGYFPSFSLAWRLVQESFIDKINVFDDLKLRVGWGQIGNHGIRPYATLSNYASDANNLYGNITNGIDIPLYLQNIANPDLKWETTQQINLGLDFAFFESRLTGSVDAYSKITKDLLQNVPIPLSSGFLNVQVNRGEIENRGIEANLNAIVFDKNNLRISIGGNIAFNKTKLKNLGLTPSSILIDGQYKDIPFYEGNIVSRGNIFKYAPNVFIEGEETSLFYGFKTDGIYQVNDPLPGGGLARMYDPSDDNPPLFWAGDYKIIDQNGDGVIDLRDRTIIGNPNPDFVYGINLEVNYKKLSLRVLANGVYGNDVANGNLLQLAIAEGIPWSNITNVAYNNAWRPEKPSNIYPRIGYTTNGMIAMPDRIVEDGSFLRLSTINLGYQFDKVNLYVSAQNLFTFTAYSGYNPEVTSFLYDGLRNGVDWNGQPNARKFLIGLK